MRNSVLNSAKLYYYAYTYTNNIDDDECLLGTDNCEQVCVNTVGVFECECGSGYQLKSDGANCTGSLYTCPIANQ